MSNQDTILHKVGGGILELFRQDHRADRYRSRLWYMLPVLFNLPGGIVAFLAIRHDDLDKAKNCLLLGIILLIPLILLGIAAAAAVEAISEIAVSDICAEMSAESAEALVADSQFVEMVCE
ncbi:MAG: hypothetical protein IS632_08070 [Thaumarchaeota archaeon]|nr:hypothetical protein [Nitrososphaerota archaeon]